MLHFLDTTMASSQEEWGEDILKRWLIHRLHPSGCEMHLGAHFPVVFWSRHCQRTQVQPTGVGGSPGKVQGEGGTNTSQVSPKRAEPRVADPGLTG